MDRAKISAIVIREAVRSIGPPSPVVAGIADQNAIETGAFSFAVPADAFADDGGVENLTLTAKLADDLDLPDWLVFDGTTFTGTPPDGAAGDLAIKVLADDGTNPPAETTFTLTIADDGRRARSPSETRRRCWKPATPA